MDSKDLQSLLDSLDEGPLGKPQYYWENLSNLELSQTKDSKQKRASSYSNEKRKQAAKLAQKTMNSDPKVRSKQQRGNKDKKVPVKAYKVITTGRGKTWKVIDKQYLGTYNSHRECAFDLDIPPGYVSAVLIEGNNIRSVKGFMFEEVVIE